MCYIPSVRLGPESCSQDTYRRQARRLRWRLRDDRPALQQQLKQLAQSRDEPSPRVTPAPIQAPAELGNGALSPAGIRFAAMARAHVDPGVLRYDHRQRLLAAAAGMGVERFEANLVIALLQYRQRVDDAIPAQRSTGRWFTPAAVMALLAMETCILVTVWWIWG